MLTDSRSAAVAPLPTHTPVFSEEEPRLIVEGVNFPDFYREERSALVGFVISHGANLQEASDAVQAAFAAVLPPRWETIRDPRAYLRTSALRAYYQSAPRTTAVAEFDEQVSELAGRSTPLDLAEAEEGARWVVSVLATLPLKQRQVMAWYIDGYSYAEIAKMLRIPVTAVRKNFSRARKALENYHFGQQRDAG
ncbi:RNA polymerase sigma factor [Streptosporangium saharense]|uniref:RNA polymerase sigma factor n=1 Tax=Streptosporangium saharense TaxID=1706840 RepID=UPI003332F453